MSLTNGDRNSLQRVAPESGERIGVHLYWFLLMQGKTTRKIGWPVRPPITDRNKSFSTIVQQQKVDFRSRCSCRRVKSVCHIYILFREVAFEFDRSRRNLPHFFKLLMRHAIAQTITASDIRSNQKAAIDIAKMSDHIHPD